MTCNSSTTRDLVSQPPSIDMPRSARAAGKPPTTRKRTTKRSASRQPKCYEIPESPSSDEVAGIKRQPIAVLTTPYQISSNASQISKRGEKESNASTFTADEDCESTLIQPTRRDEEDLSEERRQVPVAGFEALEAVSGLYEKLKENNAELERFSRDNHRLIEQEELYKSQIEKLQAELRIERDRVRRLQNAYEKEVSAALKGAEKRLHDICTWLRSYSAAASRITPLLEALTGVADVKHDREAEEWYHFLKEHDRQETPASPTEPKKRYDDH